MHLSLQDSDWMRWSQRFVAWGLTLFAICVALSKAAEEGSSDRRKVIGYAISVTHDGPYMDGAAVLAHAIRTASARSKYAYELVAIVHPNVKTSREPIRRAGWR
jgi:hypothetical protein